MTTLQTHTMPACFSHIFSVSGQHLVYLALLFLLQTGFVHATSLSSNSSVVLGWETTVSRSRGDEDWQVLGEN